MANSASSTQSKRFRELERNINKIGNFFLPKIKVTGEYSEKEINSVRGYRLLVHAEIESYFEDVAENLAKKTLTNWEKTKNPSHVVSSILAFMNSKESKQDIPETFDDLQRSFIEDRVTTSIASYISILKQNNGIKQKDLLKILLPLGIAITEIDSTWLTEMDSFGKERGDVAHKSIGAQIPLDPASEQQKIHDNILPEIQHLDSKIRKLK
jgi:hypothetical protein